MILVLNFDERAKVDIASTKLASQGGAKPFDSPSSSVGEIGKLTPLLILNEATANAQMEVETRHHVECSSS
jgi:hypothetical protein